MAIDFYGAMKEAYVNSDANVSVTENGALGYRTTGRALLDLNFAISSLRSAPDAKIIKKFAAACAEDLDTAIVWLFFCRDCRNGVGERRLFRVCVKYLAKEFPGKLKNLLPLFAEYGRWDDLFCLAGTKLQGYMLNLCFEQMQRDYMAYRLNEPMSLLAKWLPSEKSRVPEQRELAKLLAVRFNLTPRNYRKLVSRLRKKLGVVEIEMSGKKWSDIDYNKVPSRANVIYRKAFLRHDELRRQEYLDDLRAGRKDVKINASVLMPCDIVHSYRDGRYKYDETLEALWTALPNTVPAGAETIVVADGSGSMQCGYGNMPRPLDVANALAIYFAERLGGVYHNKYITFSARPQLVDLGGANTLHGKINIALQHSEVSNTNIEAVFDLILDTALRNKLRQEELPKNILIISDMEFDEATTSNPSKRLFDAIAERYAEHDYKLPRLVFWNVDSRTDTIPVKENKLGVALVSGFSPNIARMVMSGNLDPYDCLVEQLHNERYAPVWEALKGNG